MEQIAISPAGEFIIEGVHFVIDVSTGERRPSDAQAFTIVKNEFYLRFYEELARSFTPRSILELGVFQGGSYVLLDKLFQPERMSAVELNKEPVARLVDYCEKSRERFVHFATSQSDRTALAKIVREELHDELDLVVDDASHSYSQTKASFEFLFPLLSPGGIYLIEDWSWAHASRYQGAEAPSATQPALTNLLFEQIMLLGSSNDIAEIRITRPLYLIRKGRARARLAEAKDSTSIFNQILSRGKKPPLI